MNFRLYPLRFSFVAREPVHFPKGKSANLLRGAFGSIFRRLACTPDCAGPGTCEIRTSCPYARMFEPAASPRTAIRWPSGLADWPRPFVFRATHLDGYAIPPGAPFFFDFNLFDMSGTAIAYLVSTFAQLANEGLGPRRGRADLTEVSQLNESGQSVTRIYDGASLVEPIVLSLDPLAERIERVRVQFVTPTELKSGDQLARQPEFSVLASRIRDRLSTLRERYDDGPLALDFRGFGERAARIQMTRCQLERIDTTRRSSRTGQVHSIGGFVGEAAYEGDLSEFIPYLRAARWTGVGRQTVWGKGEIRALV